MRVRHPNQSSGVFVFCFTRMLLFSSSWWFELFLVFSLLLFAYYVHFKLVASKYWEKRNVFQEDPLFLLGNNWEVLLSENISFLHEKRYRKWKHKKIVGFYSFMSPAVMITDLELIKRVLVRDFNYFMDRGINVNEEQEPLAGHLVNLTGSKWRNLRVKLTPTFTSGKMKMMFPIMVECGLEMQKFLTGAAKGEEVLEMREILARFTTDIISSCAFGIETNCINNPDSEFRDYGRRIFRPGLALVMRFLLTSFFPRIRDLLGVRSIPEDVSNFFIKVVKETMDYREANNIKRNDFMDLLIQLKNKGKVDEVDAKDKHEHKTTLGTVGTVPEGQKFTLHQAAAQAFVFFAAGFETSSTTLAFACYELSLAPDVQSDLQKEIDANLDKNDGKITYEGVNEMELLDRVIQETLRKYPPLTFLGRKCTNDYEIPEMGVKFEKGTRVVISLLGIQKDPDFFPNPEKFDPSRFLPEEKAKRDHFTSMPFGEGPRNCIGNRFGLLQTKVGLVSILSKYNLEVSEETPIPMVFDKRAFLLTPLAGIPLKISQRFT